MQNFTAADLKHLAETDGKLFVSIFAPMHRSGREVTQNEIRFGNLLDEAEQQLKQMGHDARILAAAKELIGDDKFWQNQSDGLAAFYGENLSKTYRVPVEFEETVVVGCRPHVKPLTRIFSDENQWYILAASLKGIRLMLATPHGVDEIELDSLPGKLKNALNIDEYVSTLQHHSTSTHGRGQGGHDVVHHGQGGGDPENQKKDEILQYFQRLDDAFEEYFGVERTPMVFAGVGYLFPIFKEACQYNGIVDEPLEGNPDEMSPQDLHDKTWEIIKPRLQEKLSETVETFNNKAHTDWASDDLLLIHKAAQMGQIETLLVQKDLNRWATFDEAQVPMLVDTNSAEAEDLVNRIVVQTLINGGEVFNLSHDDMPQGSEIAAVFRSPVGSYVS